MYFVGNLRQMDRVDFNIFNICYGLLIRFVFGQILHFVGAVHLLIQIFFVNLQSDRRCLSTTY